MSQLEHVKRLPILCVLFVAAAALASSLLGPCGLSRFRAAQEGSYELAYLPQYVLMRHLRLQRVVRGRDVLSSLMSDPMSERYYGMFLAYAKSKLAQVGGFPSPTYVLFSSLHLMRITSLLMHTRLYPSLSSSHPPSPLPPRPTSLSGDSYVGAPVS